MQKTVEKFLKEYGQEIVVETIGTVRAMLQPTYFKSQYNMEKAFSPQGVSYKSQYVYIGPVEAAMKPGFYLRSAGKRYLVRQVQNVCYKGVPVYVWGMCVEVGG